MRVRAVGESMDGGLTAVLQVQDRDKDSHQQSDGQVRIYWLSRLRFLFSYCMTFEKIDAFPENLFSWTDNLTLIIPPKEGSRLLNTS